MPVSEALKKSAVDGFLPPVERGIGERIVMQRFAQQQKRKPHQRLCTDAWGAAAVTVCVAVVWILLAHQTAAAQMGRARTVAKARLRATPPGPTWDKASQASFFDDAFLTLTGDRPDFGSVSAPTRAEATDSPPSESAPAGGFRWSSLVSPDTLVDEIKDTKGLVAAAVASPSDFKGGGYDKAREGFSSVALAFGVIAAHDGDVRWKKDAVTARDLFARVGFNCKVGTDQSFSESRARVADLETLLDGSPLKTQAEREEDFLWSQVAARPALMSRLEVADEFLGGAIASKSDFTKQVEKVLHEIEMVAVISEVIQQKDFEYHDDDGYRAYAAAMRDAAVKAREGATKGDYDGVRASVGAIKKSCDSCHADYRS